MQSYANAMADTVVYARCFVQELNKTAQKAKQVNDLPFVAPVARTLDIFCHLSTALRKSQRWPGWPAWPAE